jgi:hypothetical protein
MSEDVSSLLPHSLALPASLLSLPSLSFLFDLWALTAECDHKVNIMAEDGETGGVKFICFHFSCCATESLSELHEGKTYKNDKIICGTRHPSRSKRRASLRWFFREDCLRSERNLKSRGNFHFVFPVSRFVVKRRTELRCDWSQNNAR